jgi:hypothetical protein
MLVNRSPDHKPHESHASFRTDARLDSAKLAGGAIKGTGSRFPYLWDTLHAAVFRDLFDNRCQFGMFSTT